MADAPASQSQGPKQRPGRKPLSKRQRRIFAITLGAAVAIVVVVGGVLALTSGNAPAPRATTLPPADQGASAELKAAAEAIGYSAPSGAGVGTIEDAPAESVLPPSNPNLLPVGAEAPAFTLKTPTGEEVSLSDFRGKAVLLEIFATWCPHCAAEAPHLADLANSLSDSDYAVVSIDGSGEDAASVFAYHAYFGLPFPALLDPDPNSPLVTYPAHGSTGPVSRSYQTGYFPTFYVIDREGKITWRSDGEQPDALLRQELQRAAGA